PADEFKAAELQIPLGHCLGLPDRRAGSFTEGRSLGRAGWLLGAEHVLGRVWFRSSRRHDVQAVPRGWPWLDPIGLVLGPVVWMLRDCWAQDVGARVCPRRETTNRRGCTAVRGLPGSGLAAPPVH